MPHERRPTYATYEFTATPDGSQRQLMLDVVHLLDLVERGRVTGLVFAAQVDCGTIHTRTAGRFTCPLPRLLRTMADQEEGR